MVSSINPGISPGASALGLDPRLQNPNGNGLARREQGAPLGDRGDRVEISGASLAAVRESVRAAVSQVHQALAIGHDAQIMLVRVQDIAREGGPDAQADLDGLLQAFTSRLDAAVQHGARLVAGKDVVVEAEPGAAPVTIAGVDLSLDGDIIDLPQAADASALGQAAQRSLEALQDAMGKLLDSARALEAHQGFLGAVEGALGGSVRGDLDTESARLLALQVRQGLEGLGAQHIANAEPQAVLALFRA
jgi:hypothetical protein